MKRCSVVPYEGEKEYLFVSYSHKDPELVFPILEKLDKDGYRIWYDEGIIPGSEWPETIADHLKNSAAFVCLVTKNFLESKNCLRELNFALKKQIPFLSIMLEDVEMSSGVEMQLSVNQAILKYLLPTDELFYEKVNSTRILAPAREIPLTEPERKVSPSESDDSHEPKIQASASAMTADKRDNTQPSPQDFRPQPLHGQQPPQPVRNPDPPVKPEPQPTQPKFDQQPPQPVQNPAPPAQPDPRFVQQPANVPTQKPKKKSSAKPVIVILSVVFALLIAGGGVFAYFYFFSGEKVDDYYNCKEIHKNVLKNTVKTTEYNSDKETIKWSSSNGESFEQKFDSDGKLISEEKTGGKDAYKIELTYSKENNSYIGTGTFDSDESHRYEIFYNMDSKLEIQNHYYNDDIWSSVEYTYYDNGVRMQKDTLTRVSTIDGPKRTGKVMYDKDGNPVSNEQYVNGELIAVNEYKDGFVVKNTHYSFKYPKDEKGKVKITGHTVTEYENRIITGVKTYDKDNNLTEYSVTVEDKPDHMKMEMRDSSDNLTGYSVFTFDKKHHLIGREDYDKNDKLTDTYEYFWAKK